MEELFLSKLIALFIIVTILCVAFQIYTRGTSGRGIKSYHETYNTNLSTLMMGFVVVFWVLLVILIGVLFFNSISWLSELILPLLTQSTNN